MNEEVKQRRRGATTVSSKHQVTIPIGVMRAAGLRTGDRLRAVPRGRGRVLLVREEDPVGRHAGALTGTYRSGELDELRDEWR
ncbi:MAG: AbrB/MazE/SpoVT family DNA-binding domain-containing protein [Chloroflexi bacterium]|nr:AbrB/MazE/SpoVT family DNA-binding domain-containing protein [Chloroflexota bacterium]